MRPRTAVALVAAGMVSVFVYPIIGLRFLHQAREEAPGGTSEQRNTNDTEAA